VLLDVLDYFTAARNNTCPEPKNARNGVEVRSDRDPSKYLDWTLADIASHFGNGALLWRAGRARQGIKFVPYEIKKKRGRKPKPKSPTARNRNRVLAATP